MPLAMNYVKWFECSWLQIQINGSDTRWLLLGACPQTFLGQFCYAYRQLSTFPIEVTLSTFLALVGVYCKQVVERTSYFLHLWTVIYSWRRNFDLVMQNPDLLRNCLAWRHILFLRWPWRLKWNISAKIWILSFLIDILLGALYINSGQHDFESSKISRSTC